MTAKPHYATPGEALTAMKASIASELDRLRVEIADRQTRLESVDDGAVPKDEYRGRMEQWIDDLAQQFERSAEYRVSALRLPNPRPRDVELLRVPVRGAIGASPEAVAEVDAGPMLAWLFGTEIKTKLGALIEAAPYEAGPPTAERKAMRARLQAELDDIETREEALIVEGEAGGLTLHRRPDARPEIILSLEAA